MAHAVIDSPSLVSHTEVGAVPISFPPTYMPEGAKKKTVSTPLGFVRKQEPQTTKVFDTYWRFATERQSIFFKRLNGDRGPWTSDRILGEYKFTNAYRAADRTSQYLIREVINKKEYGLRDEVLRILLFKVFNKIETWQLVEEFIGEITEESFSVSRIDSLFEKALGAKASIYSAAYIMPSGPAGIRQPRKHLMHLQLLESLLKQDFPERLAGAHSMAECYELLLGIPGFGPFLAYQYATDLNYSEHFAFSEMEFVVPGPGARDGMRKCFSSLGDYSEADAIRWVAERQAYEFAQRELDFQSLWGRPLQLIDCQNLFCEVDKYARVAHPDVVGCSGRVRIKQRFAPQSNFTATRFEFPKKWNLLTGQETPYISVGAAA